MRARLLRKFKKDRKYKTRRRVFSFSLFLIAVIGAVALGNRLTINSTQDEPASVKPLSSKQAVVSQTEVTIQTESIPETPKVEIPYPLADSSTVQFGDDVTSEYAVLVDVSANKILAQRNSSARIYPASLTKVMTLIIAAEKATDTEKTFTMTNEIIDPLVRQDATRAGFEDGEAVKIIDMMYGAILPSGADATVGLAKALCGSENAFVELMNEKAKSLGLKDTHFMNTSGLHDSEHYSTPEDMAVILEYAMKNELCRKILSTYQYTTASTPQHPNGILLESTMFSRMYGTEVENVTILGGKMGYTDEAGNCLASFAVKNGKEYVAVTTKGSGKYAPIFDSFKIYGNYIDASQIAGAG